MLPGTHWKGLYEMIPMKTKQIFSWRGKQTITLFSIKTYMYNQKQFGISIYFFIQVDHIPR